MCVWGGGDSVPGDRVPEETVQKLIYHDQLGEPHSARHLDVAASEPAQTGGRSTETPLPLHTRRL